MKSNHWLENSKKNLVPISISDDFKSALSEWKISGNFVDHENREEVCELCEHPELRYHYEIINKKNKNTLWVGSSCILRFSEIEIYDNSGKLIVDENSRKEHLTDIIKKNRVDEVLNPLRRLWRIDKDNRKDIEWIVDTYKRSGGFETYEICWLFRRMNKFHIKYKPGSYSISFRSKFSRDEFMELDNKSLELIKDSLTLSQKKKYLTQRNIRKKI